MQGHVHLTCLKCQHSIWVAENAIIGTQARFRFVDKRTKRSVIPHRSSIRHLHNPRGVSPPHHFWLARVFVFRMVHWKMCPTETGTFGCWHIFEEGMSGLTGICECGRPPPKCALPSTAPSQIGTLQASAPNMQFRNAAFQ